MQRRSALALPMVLVLSGLSFLYPPLAAPDRGELRSVVQSIEQQNARWSAGETSMSLLPPEDRRRRLGLTRVRALQEDTTPYRETSQAEDLPNRLDWRQHLGANWVTPVKDQGACGSCWAFATLAGMESVMTLSASNPTLRPDLSEQFLLSCSPGTCGGFWLGATMAFLQSSGTVDESCLPYVETDTVPCSNRCKTWEQRLRKIASWSYVPNHVAAIRAALNQAPLPTTLDVYTDFFYYTGGVYQHVWGDWIGGHAVLLLGYDDIEHAWIAKNSWGTGWGEQGYFRIRWGDSGVGADTVLIRYEQPCDRDGDESPNPDCGGSDCDDSDYKVHPGAAEICDGKDTNCDGFLPQTEMDQDKDDWPLCNDCDDRRADRNPGAKEICGNGVDEDCSGLADDLDEDNDGYLHPACGGNDCNDQDEHVYPGAPEICDGQDSDCDGRTPRDEFDWDGDTWLSCAGDCNDKNPSVYPGAAEICANRIDDDCDGHADDADTECAVTSDWSAPPQASASEGRTRRELHEKSRIWGAVAAFLVPFLIALVLRVIHAREAVRAHIRR